jgi:hypothetical protein
VGDHRTANGICCETAGHADSSSAAAEELLNERESNEVLLLTFLLRQE